MWKNRKIRLTTEILVLSESICSGLIRLHYAMDWREIDSWIMCGVVIFAFLGDLIDLPILEFHMLRTTALLFWIDVLVMLIRRPLPYMVPRYILEILLGILIWWVAGTLKSFIRRKKE